jgi:peptide/nickel transport system substrate-binding protein
MVEHSGWTRRAMLGLMGGLADAATRSTQAADMKTQRRPPRHGGTINLLVDPEPTTLVALTDSADPTMAVSAKVTEGLLCYDFDLRPRPQLATEWLVDDDARTFTFKLRDGVRWHDGAEFTSADVAFSILLLKQVHPRGRATFANVTDVATPDRLTAIVQLAKPAPYLLRAFAACESPIVPRHIYDGTDAVGHPNGEAPIGTGPFRFGEWVKGRHISYERNPDYWDAEKPYLDGLVVNFLPDEATRLAALENDPLVLAPGSPISHAMIDRLKTQANLRLDTNGYQYTNQVLRLEFNLDHPILKQHCVRQAIAHALNRRAILATAWHGYGVVDFGPISPQLKSFYFTDVPHYDFDPQAAEQILDTAGFQRDRDGVRFRLTHDYVPAGDGYRKTAEYVAQALAQIGIAVTVRSQDFASYVRRVYQDRTFDFATGRANNMFDPTVGVQRLFWSKNFKRGVPFSNGSHYDSAEADTLLEAAAVEIDPVKRRERFVEFQKLIARDIPDLTLLAPLQFTISNRRIVDHTVTADGVNGSLADAFIVA